MKKVWIALAGLAVATLASGELAKFKDWAKSPEASFLTRAEKDQWSKISTDEEAEKFVADYWARRDPTPGTPANEFKDEIHRRIAAADEQFKMRRQKGAESARGRLLVTLGLPSRVSQQRPQESAVDATGGVTAPSIDTTAPTQVGGAVVVTWTYDKTKFDPSLGIGEVRARVNVDPQRGTDELLPGSNIEKAIAKIADASIVSTAGAVAPDAAAVPQPSVPGAATGPVPPGPASAAAAPAAAPTSTLPAAARSVLESVLTQRKGSGEAAYWGAPFRTIAGEPFYAFQFYLPGDRPALASATGVKFGGLVRTEAGQEVAAFWEDAALTDTKTGQRADKVFDRSVALPPGSYRASFGLFSAEGQALTSAQSSFALEAATGQLEVSPLLLSNSLTPLTTRPAPTDPFVFGMEKPIKVEPKADRLFAKTDSLWYFYTVANPTVAEAAAPAPTPAPAPAPAPGATPGAAPTGPAPAAVPQPRIMTRIAVLRGGQNAFQPVTAPAELQQLGPRYYASGSEIPLETFEPGHYTFALTVRDLNAAKDSAAFKGIEQRQDFVVLTPDGALPPKPAQTKPAPAAKPTPKKKP